MAGRELQLTIELCRFSRRRRRPTVIDLGRLADLRFEYDQIAAANPLKEAVRNEPIEAGGVPAEWLTCAGSNNDCAFIYLHGGCYVSGSVDTHRDIMSRLAIATSMRVLGLNYRLAPAHAFPAAVEDSVAAYRWLVGEGVEPARIAIAGDSAGAGLAIATAMKLRDEGYRLPGALACISPWVDLAITGASVEGKANVDPIVNREMLVGWGNLYLNGSDPRTPLASPLYGDLRGLPPILIQAGSDEVLLDDAVRLEEKMTAAGVDVTLEIWPEMIHVWHSFAPILPQGREAIERIGSFIRTRLKQSS